MEYEENMKEYEENTLNLPKRDASRHDKCGKFQPIIGRRGTWKNSELYLWGKYKIFEPLPPILEICTPLSLPFRAQMLMKYEEDMKEI